MNNYYKHSYMYPAYQFYRNSPNPCPPPPPPKPAHPPKPAPPPKKKFNFKIIKKNTCKSLNDVEYFLNNFSQFIKYYKLTRLLK